MQRDLMLSILTGAIVAVAILGPASHAQDAGEGPNAPVAADVSIGSLITETATGPTFLFVLRAIGSIVIVIGLTEATRRMFRVLREDTDAASVRTRLVALSYGVFLGVVGLAPEVPAFSGRVSTLLGGVTCAVFSIAGVSFWKSFLGARAEKRELTPPPGGPTP